MMNNERQKALGWILGAAFVVVVLGLYLLLTSPGVDLLSENYSVM